RLRLEHVVLRMVGPVAQFPVPSGKFGLVIGGFGFIRINTNDDHQVDAAALVRSHLLENLPYVVAAARKSIESGNRLVSAKRLQGLDGLWTVIARAGRVRRRARRRWRSIA